MRLKGKERHNKVDFLAVSEAGTSKLRNSFKWRYLSIYLMAILIFTFLFIHLFNLQIIEGSQNLLIASKINQTTDRVLPPRGLILDRNGRKLAFNVPAYSLSVNPNMLEQESEESSITLIANTLKINKDELLDTYNSKIYKKGERVTVERVTLMSDLEFEEYLKLLIEIENLPGFNINVEPVREYVDSTFFAHILGYVGDPTQEDIEEGIFSEAQIGKVGIEKSYDGVLRGVEGIEVKEKGIFDNRERVYRPQEVQYGDNVYLTVDSRWQKRLTKIMEKQLAEVDAFASAGVIMNSRTGEIKAMVSLPNYDNNLFAKGITAKDFNQLINNPKTPLLNRTIGLQLPPGSVWKVIGATAGLEEGVITENTEFFSNRCLELPGEVFFCEADRGYLGNVNIRDALAQSSNIFFCNVALELNAKRKGIRSLIKYATGYGLGQTTGVDIPGEQKGTMASPELKEELFNEPWYLGDECNTIIGQGLVTVTPLQLTVVSAAIQNGGRILEPHLLLKIEDQAGDVVAEAEPKVTRDLEVTSKTLEIIRDGMRQAALYGTAQGLDDLPGNVIAKTGSSDAGEYIQGKYYSGAHSWVIGCFDFERENYCFTTMQQWGGRGYKTVPIMKKFINCLYNDFANNCEAI